jgi:hypothetical protein
MVAYLPVVTDVMSDNADNRRELLLVPRCNIDETGHSG